jgi:2-succinyl-5-enolpyruvyl-6-hydroxy-3-cyclohexene-1-carboxylate synthase
LRDESRDVRKVVRLDAGIVCGKTTVSRRLKKWMKGLWAKCGSKVKEWREFPHGTHSACPMFSLSTCRDVRKVVRLDAGIVCGKTTVSRRLKKWRGRTSANRHRRREFLSPIRLYERPAFFCRRTLERSSPLSTSAMPVCCEMKAATCAK